MNWLDLVIIIVLIVSGVSGARNGLVKSVLGLAGVVVGIVLAGRFYHGLADKLTFIDTTYIAQAVAFAIILVATMIVAGILASIIQHALHLALLGLFDRLAGFAFGVVLGAFFAAAVLTFFARFNVVNIVPTVKGSAIATALMNGFPIALGLLPHEFDSVRNFFR